MSKLQQGTHLDHGCQIGIGREDLWHVPEHLLDLPLVIEEAQHLCEEVGRGDFLSITASAVL